MTTALDVGSWPAWVSAIISIVALSVSSITLRNGLADKIAEAAVAVDVYFDGASSSVAVHNHGDQSIYQVLVVLRASGSPWELETSRATRIGPSESGRFRAVQHLDQAETQGPSFLEAIVTFVDARGRHWWRSSSGTLRRRRPWRRLTIDHRGRAILK